MFTTFERCPPHRRLSRSVIEAAKILGIRVMDHINFD